MPTPTYIPLATKTLTATATSVTFSSISQAYRDLVLVAVGSGVSNTHTQMTFNNVTAGYNQVEMLGDGSTTASLAVANRADFLLGGYYNNFPSGAVAQTRINIFDYSATDKHKSILLRVDVVAASGPQAMAYAGRWADTSAVTTIKLTGRDSNFAIGSTFSLYGIASA